MSHADLVSHWFAQQVARGEIARDGAAYDQVLKAKDDLVARLDGRGDKSFADVVREWPVVAGALGRNTEAFNQLQAARVDLVARLEAAAAAAAAQAKPKWKKKKPPQPQPAAAAASED